MLCLPSINFIFLDFRFASVTLYSANNFGRFWRKSRGGIWFQYNVLYFQIPLWYLPKIFNKNRVKMNATSNKMICNGQFSIRRDVLPRKVIFLCLSWILTHPNNECRKASHSFFWKYEPLRYNQMTIYFQKNNKAIFRVSIVSIVLCNTFIFFIWNYFVIFICLNKYFCVIENLFFFILILGFL